MNENTRKEIKCKEMHTKNEPSQNLMHLNVILDAM